MNICTIYVPVLMFSFSSLKVFNYVQFTNILLGCTHAASYKFHYPKYYSDYTYLIPLSKLQDGSDFLADDTCVFGLDILRARKFKPTRNAKGVTIQHVFLQTKGFMQGNYTWNIEDSKLDLKSIICSPKFDIGEHKWYAHMVPVSFMFVFI